MGEAEGAKRFVEMRLPQLQHRNPNVQFVTYSDLTPTPFIQIFLDNNKELIVDLFGKESHDIWNHLKKLLGSRSRRNHFSEYNKALIGSHAEQFECVCKLPGQLRCSSQYSFGFGRRDEYWTRDYLTWYPSGFYTVRKRKEGLENN